MTIVLIGIGALGTVSDMFEKYAKKLNVTIMLEVIQKAANNNIMIAIKNFQNSFYQAPKSSALYKNPLKNSKSDEKFGSVECGVLCFHLLTLVKLNYIA